jgi:hypothetical protein
MKLLFPIISIAIVCAIAENFLPWWSIAPIAFFISYFLRLKPGMGFLAGFLALFILWGLMAFKIDFSNDHILSSRIAMLFPLKGNYVLLFLLTGLIGGLVAGLGALSGSLLRKN